MWTRHINERSLECWPAHADHQYQENRVETPDSAEGLNYDDINTRGPDEEMHSTLKNGTKMRYDGTKGHLPSSCTARSASISKRSSAFALSPPQEPSKPVPSSVEERAQSSSRPAPAPLYSLSELIATLSHENDTSTLSPELERRVLDFRLAQQKRLEKYGQQHKWGIFGLYAHLSNVRIDLEWSEDAAWRRTNREPYLSWSDFDAMQVKNPVRPWFTYFVIFLCSVMLLVEFGLNDWKVEPLSTNPLIGPSAQALVDSGARETNLIIQGQWFRLFSPLFLHAGVIHYVVNMAALWFIGGAVEESHGILNGVFLFFVPGIGGNILSSIFLPQYISVGASGGIFGLIGGCIADLTLNWKLLFISGADQDTSASKRNFAAILCLVMEIVVNLLIGLTPYGGLVYGVCCGWSILVPLPVGFFGVSASGMKKMRKALVRFIGVIFSILLIIATTAILATMQVGDSPCKNCRYVSCVPFPFWTEEKWWYCDDCDFVTATLYRNPDPDGNNDYDVVDLVCPDGTVESISVNGSLGGDQEVVRHKLPTFCRQLCPRKA